MNLRLVTIASFGAVLGTCAALAQPMMSPGAVSTLPGPQMAQLSAELDQLQAKIATRQKNNASQHVSDRLRLTALELTAKSHDVDVAGANQALQKFAADRSTLEDRFNAHTHGYLRYTYSYGGHAVKGVLCSQITKNTELPSMTSPPTN